MTSPAAGAPGEAEAPDAGQRRSTGHRLLRWAGLAAATVAAVYFLIHAAEQWRVLPDAILSARAALWAGPLLMVYFASALISGFAWHRLLRATGEDSRLARVLAIWLLTHVAKYVPGNVAQHVGRAGLARAAGYRTARVVTTLAIEAGLLVAVAGTLATLVLVARGPAWLAGTPAEEMGWPVLLAGAGAIAIALAALPWLALRLPMLRRRLSPSDPLCFPKARVLILCALIYMVNFLAIGLCLDLLALQVFAAEQSHLAWLTGVYAAAWVLGFLVPGAPAGLGVREAVLLAALGPLYGAATAVGLAVALRVITTFGDGVLSLAGWVLHRGQRREATALANQAGEGLRT